MPYALFSNDAKLSKAYPTEADVWKVASKSGLVVDVATDEEKAHPATGARQRIRDQVLQSRAERRSCQKQG